MSKKSFRVKEDGYYTSIMLFIYLILLYTVDKQTPRTNNLTRSKLRTDFSTLEWKERNRNLRPRQIPTIRYT